MASDVMLRTRISVLEGAFVANMSDEELRSFIAVQTKLLDAAKNKTGQTTAATRIARTNLLQLAQDALAIRERSQSQSG